MIPIYSNVKKNVYMNKVNPAYDIAVQIFAVFNQPVLNQLSMVGER